MVMLLIQQIEKSGYKLTLATDIAKQCELSTLFFVKKGKGRIHILKYVIVVDSGTVVPPKNAQTLII